LSARLIAVRAPKEVVEERRQKLYDWAKDKGRPVSARRLALAEWTVYVTVLPEAMLSVAEALVLAKLRWQIELLFKLWKKEGKLNESRSEKPWRAGYPHCGSDVRCTRSC
jgi:hypothetical protein